MKKILATIVSYPAAWLLPVAMHLPDSGFVAVLRFVRWLIRLNNPNDFRAVVVGDALKIFIDPASAAMARRMIRETRPEQLRAVIRGALF